MIALIDSDIYRYQFGSVEMAHPFAGEGTVPEDATVPASSEYVRHLVDLSIKEVVEATGADSYICALSGKGNFRNDIAKQSPYKGNRDPNTTRPFHYPTITDHITSNHPHVVVDDIEADDWLGITQRSNLAEYCIASRDKDLKGVPGWHYRFACGKSQPAIPMHWMTEEESMHFFFYQLLIGDNTDNILGCGKREMVMWGGKEVLRRKGIGSKTALKMLDGLKEPQEFYEVCKEAYRNVFGDEHEEVMLEMARLLYIGQMPDSLFNWSWLGISVGDQNKESLNEVSPSTSD